MQISHATLQLASEHDFQRQEVREESLRLWVGNERPDFAADNAPGPTSGAAGDRVTLSPAARNLQLQPLPPPPAPAPATEDLAPPGEDPRLTTMRLILEAMTGKKIAAPATPPDASQAGSPAALAPPAAPPGNGTPPRAGWGLEYDLTEKVNEQESLHFQAQGQVRTADGRHLQVEVNLHMLRQESTSTELHIRAGDARLVDPLAVNFAGGPASLSAAAPVIFDLDQDGRGEQMAFLGPGSGFLYLDRNQDGRPTDGGELFGPRTGDGFSELAQLDSDGNGWLDDGDPMFAKLQVWARDVAGSDYFAGLGALGIGAVALDHRDTPFTLKEGGRTLGQVAASGIFLRHDGSSGTVQDILLTV